jgi:hypothetical protein
MCNPCRRRPVHTLIGVKVGSNKPNQPDFVILADGHPSLDLSFPAKVAAQLLSHIKISPF